MGLIGKMGLFHHSEEKKVLKELQRLDKVKTPVRMEIEGESIHFRTVFSIKRDLLVIAKPYGLKRGLKRDGFVRFKVPDAEEDLELRLKVAVPHFNMLNGAQAFLCHIPKEFAETSLRDSMRYNTTRYANLFLFIPSQKQQFRIIDMSDKGCKVFVGVDAEQEEGELAKKKDTNGSGNGKKNGAKKILEMGEQIQGAQILVGKNVEINLEMLVPRSRHQKTAGFQFRVDANGDSAKYLTHFMKQLDASQEKRLSTPLN